jgi:Na+(H+)/acetate symporter ActP
MKYILIGIGIIALFVYITIYACCRVASRCSRQEEEYYRE